MSRKISFLSYKGGVGKTSLAVNVGATLAQQGKRVLLIDLDTQANASIWLLGLDRWNQLNSRTGAATTLYSIFNPGETVLADCVKGDVVRNRNGKSLLPGLDLVPTGFDLVDLDSDLESGNPVIPACVIFQEQLESLEDDYDYIIFDCPPHTLKAAQCAIFCSDDIYVPANVDSLSLIGFTLLGEKLRKFRRVSSAYLKRGTRNRPAEIKGVIFNAVDPGTDVAIAEARMQVRLNQFRNWKLAAPNAKVLQTQIHRTRAIERAVVVGLPVPALGVKDREVDAIKSDYQRLASEISRQTESAEKAREFFKQAAGF